MQITYTDFRKIKLADLQEKLKEGPLEIVNKAYTIARKDKIPAYRVILKPDTVKVTRKDRVNLKRTEKLHLFELCGKSLCAGYEKIPFAKFGKMLKP